MSLTHYFILCEQPHDTNRQVELDRRLEQMRTHPFVLRYINIHTYYTILQIHGSHICTILMDL